MIEKARPIHQRNYNWRVVMVMLSADEHVALNMLAYDQRCGKEDMAEALVKQALEERGLLPLKWPLKWPPLREGERERGREGEGEQGSTPSPLHPFTPSPLHPLTPSPLRGVNGDAE